MAYNWFGVHDGLAAGARIPSARLREKISALEVLLLILCGAGAASATGFIRLGLRIPGNAIVLAVIPMALGFAVAPRRLAGIVMSASAYGTATAFSLAGLTRYGTGAIISLSVSGLIMEIALARARRGWRLYLGMVLAGITANLLALASRGTSKLLGLDAAGGMRPFSDWIHQAPVSYTLCGAVAGLIGAVCCFRLRERKPRDGMTDSQSSAGDKDAAGGSERNS